MQILNSIVSPSALKRLPREKLPELSSEIRDRIIEVVSTNGGHLAPSLGAVELAIALHYVFDCPADKIIWDVGHQAYAHKLLTGRQSEFDNLRKYKGLSGFPKISESPFDALTTGHCSTSISAGLGMACGKNLKDDTGKVIAVIGDGSMTAGLAYEGLNQAGDLKKDLIIILNDNNMSISPNVGALSSFFSRAFSKKKMQQFAEDLGEFIKSWPKIGGDAYELAKRSKGSFKSFLTPGMLFEAFNLEYFGPIDGHNLNHLIDILGNLKELKGPSLLHIKTIKGKDYVPAEENPVHFHGCGCFDISTGCGSKKKDTVLSYTKVFGDTLEAFAREDQRIVAITAAMPEGTGLGKFSHSFPDRFFDVGIAEQHAVTFAAGLALEGFKPVVAIYSTFLQRAYDQIFHDVCLDALPVVFAVDRGGIVGEDGATHHGLFDLSYLRNLPNMVVMAPKDENELRRMLKTAIEHQGPIIIRYPRGSAVGVELDKHVFSLEIGEAEVLEEGKDVLLLGIGRAVQEALMAHRILLEDGIRGTVVNCRFAKPLDADLILSLARDIPRIVTVEENVLDGGFGSAVLECLCDNGITGFDIKRIGVKDTFVEHGPQHILRAEYGLDRTAIVNASKELCGLKQRELKRMRTIGAC